MARTTISSALMLTIIVLASQTVAKPESQHRQVRYYSNQQGDVRTGIPDPYTYTPGVGAHKLHTNGKEWAEARLICQEEGGDLAIINSREEARAITNLFSNTRQGHRSTDTSNVLIGFHDVQDEGKYLTIDNRTLAEAGYEEWNIGEPNNWIGHNGEDCGAMHDTGKLNDISCFKRIAFVCELHNFDQLVDSPQSIRGDKGEQNEENLEETKPSDLVIACGAEGSRGAEGVLTLLLGLLFLLAKN